MEPFEKYTILENLNWKGTFKDGQIFVKKFSESLNGYFVCGMKSQKDKKKEQLCNLFILKDDLEKSCKIIEKSESLQSYIEKLKCVE